MTSLSSISHTRYLIAGTLVGGVLLTALGFVTAALLPPRYKPFRDPAAVVETVRANTSTNEIYTAPQGLFVSVSLRPDGSNSLQNPGLHLAVQVFVEFAIAFCLSLLVPQRSSQGRPRSDVFSALLVRSRARKCMFPSRIGPGFRLSTPWRQSVTLLETGSSLAWCWASYAAS
jgi:hypothetical protein